MPTVVSELHDILREAVELAASDVHMHSGTRLRMRIHGVLTVAGREPLSSPQVKEMLMPLLTTDQEHELEKKGHVDFAITVDDLDRFRVNVYKQQRGLDAVFRVIMRLPPTLAELGIPTHLERLAGISNGLVLVTGPAGSGKSSTIAAFLHRVNSQDRGHILTIEDPVEFVHKSKGCIINQRSVGPHTHSFADALRAALRQDPDVILVGELRDLESIDMALTASETGHLVFATLHTRNTIDSIDRLVNAFPPEGQRQIRTKVAEALRAVITQQLIPRKDGTGRVAAVEILLPNSAIRGLIRENKLFHIRSILQMGAGEGMCLMEQSLQDLVQRNLISAEEAKKRWPHGSTKMGM